MQKVVKMKVHAGGGWEGHVVFTAINPDNADDYHLSSNMAEIYAFCKKRNLLMDEEFKRLVGKHLHWEQKTGLVIPIEEIDENKFWTSGSIFLHKYFHNYY